ncbi:MAG: HEPN domain-containing protein [Elusimicrobia bacterium]|nr:HEPN domain-containing protein [Elusimicrobiota bacterium]
MTKNDEIKKLIEKAERYLSIARDDIKNSNYDTSVSRAYYSMFYYTEAVLLTKELRFSKHSAVIVAFGQHFCKTGEVKLELHNILRNGFEKRNIGDYLYMKEITKEEAEKMLKDAEYFVSEIKKKAGK